MTFRRMTCALSRASITFAASGGWALSARENSSMAPSRASASSRPARNRTNPTKRSEEHTSELQSLMRISYAVFCLKKKKHKDRGHYVRLERKEEKRNLTQKYSDNTPLRRVKKNV